MKRINFNIKDRKILYGILAIVLVCVFTLTIAYAALSVTLNIMGSAEVVASSWDIKLANPRIKNGSATTEVPIISGNTLTFNTTLTNPGDFYEFIVDVVNNGSIDAMIDSVTKNPELTTEQAKYLKYEITYQNGESIASKQLLAKNTTMPIKVRLEYRNDLVASDLPTTNSNLSLSLTLNYIQSDGSANAVNNNGVKNLSIVSGDLDTVGSEICIGAECFYVMSSTEDDVTMLAKYNLRVGYVAEDDSYDEEEDDGGSIMPDWDDEDDDDDGPILWENPTGLQDPMARGSSHDDDFNEINFPWYGTIEFSSTNYFYDSKTESLLPKYRDSKYVYDSNSILYNYVENYKVYLESKGVVINEARLIKEDELYSLGVDYDDMECRTCQEWVYSTSYWTGSHFDETYLYGFYREENTGILDICDVRYDIWDSSQLGIRPVITISKSMF